MKRSLLTSLALVLLPLPLHAEDWPMWRGPRLDGSVTEKNLPITWNAKDNIAWRSDIPGVGHSSPIVVGDRVFITSCLIEKEQRLLLCYDRRDGRLLWQQIVLTAPLERKHRLNSFASSTPACDGERVFVTFARIRPRTAADADFPRRPRDVNYLADDVVSEMFVACYSLTGEKLWEKVPGQFCSRHGFCSSPILHKNLVIVNGDQDAQAFIVALDGKTGDEVWRVDRVNRTRSYCVPLIAEAGGKTQMVLAGAMTTTSYDPDTGKLIWMIDGPTEQFVASPVLGSGVFFLTAGFPEYHNLAIVPDGTGNVTKSHILWHEQKTAARKASYVPSPLAVGKTFYMISDLGALSCFDARSGERLWMEELGRHHSGSPILADGHVYLTDDDGISYVLKAGASFELVARNPLDDNCYSSPAVAQAQIFLRTDHSLWCIGK